MANETKKAQADADRAAADLIEANAVKAETENKIAVGAHVPKQESAGLAGSQQVDTPVDKAEAHAKLIDAHTRAREAAVHERVAAAEDQNRDQDRIAREREAAIKLASDVIRAPTHPISGKPVDVGDAGHKAHKIIQDVDRGIGQ
jgi:hypothetical protein